ncbi:BON domain-containing protein [Dyella marensis]|uniref:BON domain-containing protein n=1 Tax=Dyella TaxID=231454 RepID=UPI001444F1A7|nr:BON domain-containing protein [Dyella sp. SG609]NKJ20169.1 osmotically-inducible protein OsmY [Dyella sp. SG609]
MKPSQRGPRDEPGDPAGHAGEQGPRRAQPDDEDILHTICERLAGDADVDASEIDVSVRDGRVLLAGMVPSRQTRRDAEAIAESARGVHEVENRLKVESEDTPPF